MSSSCVRPELRGESRRSTGLCAGGRPLAPGRALCRVCVELWEGPSFGGVGLLEKKVAWRPIRVCQVHVVRPAEKVDH